MTHSGFSQRFMESTRGQLVALLRRGARTVDDLAQALGLTDNGIRAHLATLERDGIVRQGGSRRGEGAGKPATLFELHPDAEVLLSRAYAPVLGALLEELVVQLAPEQSRALLEGVGRRLGATMLPPPTAGHAARVQAAVGVLNGLGGAAELEEKDGIQVIRGCGCPLSAAVARRPEVCGAVEALLSEVVGTRVRQCCRHGERPSCCFEVAPAA
jgi:predicted ArsR family transcriptional regulator